MSRNIFFCYCDLHCRANVEQDYCVSCLVTSTHVCLFLLFADTTVVIIVSVSLALLVCAIIPLIFYRHFRSNPGEVTHAHRHKSA